MSLSGKTPKDTFKDILQMDNSNNGIGTSLEYIKDGEGTASALLLSDDQLHIIPQNDDTTRAFRVNTTNGTEVLAVDTTNQLVKAPGNNVNTQYAQFNIGTTETTQFADDTHQAIPFECANFSVSAYPPAFGTGTDPATTFTTEDTNGLRGGDIVPCLWYVQDAISIDAVVSLEGTDEPTGDVTRMHLFQYTFTSGSTSCLTEGALLAHNSDVTNAGSEQAYLTTWTVDSAAVAAGKVILAFFKSDSINSDYAVNIRIKYHLT